jgi:hypothetical protein
MTESSKTSIKLVGLASLIGTTIESYGFFLCALPQRWF